MDNNRTVQVATRVSGELARDLLMLAQIERRSLSNLLVIALEKFIAEHKDVVNQQKAA